MRPKGIKPETATKRRILSVKAAPPDEAAFPQAMLIREIVDILFDGSTGRCANAMGVNRSSVRAWLIGRVKPSRRAWDAIHANKEKWMRSADHHKARQVALAIKDRHDCRAAAILLQASLAHREIESAAQSLAAWKQRQEAREKAEHAERAERGEHDAEHVRDKKRAA